MVAQMYNQTFSFLPTGEEILIGIIKAQEDQIKEDERENFNSYIDDSVKIWTAIVQMESKIDMQKPLTTKILSDPEHPFVQTILYIYSMESFVFVEINKASREKDISKIEFYGPFASALGYIVHAATQKKKEQLEENITLYRGLKLSAYEIEDSFPSDEPINLTGFTSTTLDRNKACGFAFNTKTILVDDPDKMPVLLEINFTGQ